MKRVMVVTNSLTGGGAERSMNLLVNELSSRGWPVSLVPINSSESDLVEPKCEVFPIQRNWRGGVLNSVTALWRFNRVARRWKPDILILNCDLPELFGALLMRRQKMVIVEHTTHPWVTRVNFGKVIRKILRVRRSSWVAVSSHLKIWPDSSEPRAVLQNALTPFEIGQHKIQKANFLKRLVYIGRLSPEKRPTWILEISAKSGLPAQVMGYGVLMPELQEQAKAANLDITFKGYVKEPWPALEAGDLLIVPSAWEGDGLVLIEALKANLPMLIADIPDFRRFGLPEENYCKTVDDFVANISDYANRLEELLVPEDMRESILASRSIKVVGDTWETFLKSI